jgi:hypothetical protein
MTANSSSLPLIHQLRAKAAFVRKLAEMGDANAGTYLLAYAEDLEAEALRIENQAKAAPT